MAGRPVRRARPARGHPRLPGLGRPHRPAAGGRAPRAFRAAWWPPTPACPPATSDIGEAFLAWQRFSQEVPELPVGQIVARGAPRPVRAEVVAAYDAPFPDETYKEGARPVPAPRAHPARRPRHRRQPARLGGAAAFDKPFLSAFSDADPDHQGRRRPLPAQVPGTRARRTPPSPAPATSSRRTAARPLAAAVIDFIAGHHRLSRPDGPAGPGGRSG